MLGYAGSLRPVRPTMMRQTAASIIWSISVSPPNMIRRAYINGLFRDYYLYNPPVSTKSLYKYANRSVAYPHFLYRHYNGSKGYRRTLSDMMGICDACTSITLLRQIQYELHQWMSGYLPAEEAGTVCQHYVASDTSRHEIAVFWADVMHHAICRNNDGNRPTDVTNQL